MPRELNSPADYPDQDPMKAVQDETADLASHEVETTPAQRRPTGKVVRVWQSQTGKNYTLNEVFEHGHSVSLGKGSIMYADDSSVIFDVKRTCQVYGSGLEKSREGNAISPVSYVDLPGQDSDADIFSQGLAEIILTRAELTSSTSVPGWYGAAFEVNTHGLKEDEQVALNFERGGIVPSQSHQSSRLVSSTRKRWFLSVDNVSGGLSDFSIDRLVGSASTLLVRRELYRIKTPYIEEWRFRHGGAPNVAAEYWATRSQQFLDGKLSQKVRLLWAELIPDAGSFGWYRGVRAFVEVENLGYSKRVFLRSEKRSAKASYYCSVSNGKKIWLWEYFQEQSDNMLGALGKAPFVQFVISYEMADQVFLDDNGGWKYTMNWQHHHAPADW